mmetsp:Transcript_138596/g.266035  ORF Transcript_138596/g.266035 Transcript_138596/m.266035 type:complete len:110 (-) Transcript_138596:330-659(-)
MQHWLPWDKFPTSSLQLTQLWRHQLLSILSGQATKVERNADMCLSHGISHTCTYDFLTELQGSRGSDSNPVQVSNSCLFLAVQLRQAEEHQDFMHASLQLRKPYSPSAA